MICFVGKSHAPMILKEAAKQKGFTITENPEEAELVFISEDTPTDSDGRRYLDTIRHHLNSVIRSDGVLVLTSQVPPGFTRSLNRAIYYQAETLRIKDALERALNPEQHIIGCANPENTLPLVYLDYLMTFNCPILKMTYEEAEFAKIAINLTLISQVENTNRLAAYPGVRWEVIRNVLQNDKRIGPYSYLKPGRWQDSRHLLRDFVTFNEGR